MFSLQRDVDVEFLPVDERGRVLVEKLDETIGSDTFLVCCTLANDEIGTIQDVASIAEIAHRHGVAGWRFGQPRLYAKYAGANITRLLPRAGRGSGSSPPV